MYSKTIGILGLGVFGSTIAKTLSAYHCDIIAIDSNEENINRLEPYLTKGIIGDITNDELLLSAGIGDCDVVIVATGSNLESSVLAIMHCKKMNIPEIIVKAKSRISTEIFKQMGAHKVISPEKETGVRVAKSLVHRRIADFIQLDNNVSLIEFYPPAHWIGKTLSEMDIRNQYKLNLMGYRTAPNEPLNIQFTPKYQFKEDELLVAITDSATLEQPGYLNEFSN